MADIDPVNPPLPTRPPGTRQHSPDRRWRERQRRPEAPPEETTEDAGEPLDFEPLIDDYA